jgi:glycosyltransferase involved in cell wall biosynthesis
MVSIINSLGASFSHRIVSLDLNREAAAALGGHVDATVEGPPPPGSGALFFQKLVRSMQPAAVLTYNWGAIEATFGARLAGICPVIHNECGFGPEEAVRLLRRRVWARRALLNAVFQTVATSQTMLRIAHDQYKLASSKVRLIRTGVDAERYKPRRNSEARRALGMAEGTILFGYLGGLRAEKNVGMLIRAFHAAELPDARLILAGEGNCRRELEALVTELKIGAKVLFTGIQQDPAPYLSMLDVFVMSSLTEQVANAQLEAMASRLPVICTDVGDCRELLGEAAEGCVAAAGHVEGYAQILRRFAASAELRSEMGAANRRRAVERYSKEGMVREYAALLDEALRESVRFTQRLPAQLRASR